MYDHKIVSRIKINVLLVFHLKLQAKSNGRQLLSLFL